jgi:hypothetical protein
MAGKALDELIAGVDNVELEKVEITSNPMRMIRDGVKFIPTIKCGDIQVSGIFLNRRKIEDFLIKAKNQ